MPKRIAPYVLGNPDLANARVAGMAVRVAAADQTAAAMRPIIEGITAAGASTIREIAGALNARGITTARGSAWDAMAVSRVLTRS